MTEEMRNDLTHQGYIRQLFRETKDGKLPVTYYPFTGKPATVTYEVNWTAEDAEKIVEKYNLLVNALMRIGLLHDQLAEEGTRKKLLSAADLEVWNTYIQPYEPFTVDWSGFIDIPPCEGNELLALVYCIRERGQLGDLIEEEEEIWKQYCMWEEEQSQNRIPFQRRSAADLIQAARRYEKAICLKAPEVVQTEQGRLLAEEMVFYYVGKEEPVIWE